MAGADPEPIPAVEAGITETVPPPIEVPGGVAGTTAALSPSVIRPILVLLGGLMISHGWLSDEDANTAISIALIVLPMLWGLWANRRSLSVKQSLADMLPDDKARVTGRKE